MSYENTMYKLGDAVTALSHVTKLLMEDMEDFGINDRDYDELEVLRDKLHVSIGKFVSKLGEKKKEYTGHY